MAFSTQKYKNMWETLEINCILTLLMSIFKVPNSSILELLLLVYKYFIVKVQG